MAASSRLWVLVQHTASTAEHAGACSSPARGAPPGRSREVVVDPHHAAARPAAGALVKHLEVRHRARRHTSSRSPPVPHLGAGAEGEVERDPSSWAPPLAESPSSAAAGVESEVGRPGPRAADGDSSRAPSPARLKAASACAQRQVLVDRCSFRLCVGETPLRSVRTAQRIAEGCRTTSPSPSRLAMPTPPCCTARRSCGEGRCCGVPLSAGAGARGPAGPSARRPRRRRSAGLADRGGSGRVDSPAVVSDGEAARLSKRRRHPQSASDAAAPRRGLAPAPPG